MSKRSRVLNSSEQVVIDVHPHWWYLAGPVALLVLVLVAAIATAVVSAPSWADWLAVAALLAAALWLLARYIRWATTSLMVTTSRLIRRTGILGRNGREIPLSAMTDISYHQTLLDRIVGAGDLLIESAGRDSREVFPDLPRPQHIQNEICRQMDLLRSQAMTGWAPPVGSGPGYGGRPDTGSPQLSIAAQIEQLDLLRRRGLITDAEFQSKKTQLLDRL
jgi:membrane protein YdbS with pleckstrin-like domain